MIKIDHLQRQDIEIISQIHLESLENNFLPSLGLNFLKALYKGIVGKKGNYGFVAIENQKVVGFAIGTKNMKDYLKLALRSNFLELCLYLFFRLIKKPTLLKNVLETFTYSTKDVGPKAELVVIGILKKYQGMGIGKKLIKSLEEKFKKEKIKKYKLTVHSDKRAVYFYEKLRYHRISQFTLYNKIWFIYEKSL